MKIIVLSPNTDVLFTKDLLAKLKKAGELKLIKNTKPLEKLHELYTGDDVRILAVDPDFCDWKVPNSVIKNTPNLKAIVLQTTSFSWVDVDYAKSLNIPVVNLRGFSSIAVAEWATMMTLVVARKLPVVIKDNWKQDYEKHKGIELRGKVAGIVGLGRIGTAIAENMHGLGMKVQYWSKNSEDKRFKRVSLETLFKTSDVVLPAVAQNDETKNMITDEMLKTMKRRSIFVSIVHHVYNHKLLLDLVKKEKIFGYGFEENNTKFTKYPGNIWAGPELAWCTEDSLRKNAEQWVEAIVQASKGNYPTRVN